GSFGDLAENPPAAASQGVVQVDPAQMDPCSETYPFLGYLGSELRAPLTLLGFPRAELDVGLTTPDADVFVSIYDYDPLTLESEVIGTGSARARYRGAGQAPALITPGDTVHLIVPMYPVAHTVEAGHQLAVTIAGGQCGYFENPQSGEAIAAQSTRL